MKDISTLQNIVIDKNKLAVLIKDVDRDFLKSLLGIKNSQVSNLMLGKRAPSTNGLLRLMMVYNVKPEELAMVDPK